MPGVTIGTDGIIVDAEILGEAFGIDPASVPGLLRAGRITSRCETGVNEDAGRLRLTFWHEDHALRLTVTEDGTIVSRSRFATLHRSKKE